MFQVIGDQCGSNSKVKLHEAYNSNNINNDICLLFLDGEADFSSPNIGPIALPTNGEYLICRRQEERMVTKVRSTRRGRSAL